jgi:hypothetical protein
MRIQKNGRKRGSKGNGMGSHHEFSPMARGTRTKTREGKRRAQDRRQKQRGWQ